MIAQECKKLPSSSESLEQEQFLATERLARVPPLDSHAGLLGGHPPARGGQEIMDGS
jgi:hypothetical protein